MPCLGCDRGYKARLKGARLVHFDEEGLERMPCLRPKDAAALGLVDETKLTNEEMRVRCLGCGQTIGGITSDKQKCPTCGKMEFHAI